MDTQIYFNPSCSKCRTAQSLLKEQGIEASVVLYLEKPPTLDELERLMVLLGINDPRLMMRRNEPKYAELSLESATIDELLQAIAENPQLLERPILVVGERAVIGRPPERVLELL